MSAIIYAAIVVIWLIVLVPMWLRRHDAAMDERSSQRFEGAMRVLARRPVQQRVDRRYVVMPRRSAATAVHVSSASSSHDERRSKSRTGSPLALLFPGRRRGTGGVLGEPDLGLETAEGLDGGSAAAAAVAKKQPRRPVSMATRRRRTLLSLLGLTVLCIFVSSVGALPAASQVIPELLLVAFVVRLRLQARQTAAVSRQRRRDAAAPEARVRPSAPRGNSAARRSADFLFGDRRTAPEVAAEASFGGWAGVAAGAAGRGEEADIDASAVGLNVDDDSWDPKPWPKPTYAMKPAAPPVDPATFDDAADVEPARVNLGPGLESELFDDDGELDLILERDDVQPYRAPRAVND